MKQLKGISSRQIDKVYIYGLQDPRDFQIKYIGRTSMPPSRFYRHFYWQKKKVSNPQLEKWFDCLRIKNKEPIMIIFLYCNEDDSIAWERLFITKYYSVHLLNIDIPPNICHLKFETPVPYIKETLLLHS